MLPHRRRSAFGVTILDDKRHAIAAVKYCGSSGYSRAYQKRLMGHWGEADAADAASGVNYLVSSGFVDGSPVGISGWNVSGYSCLEAFWFYPDLFASGIGLWRTFEMKSSLRHLSKFESHNNRQLLFGAKEELSEEAKDKILHARSPLYHVHKTNATMLLNQGRKDNRIPPEQATSMVHSTKKYAAVKIFGSEYRAVDH